jgi:hypothetical protein
LRIPERMRAGRFFDEDFEEGSNALDMSWTKELMREKRLYSLGDVRHI